MARILDWDEAHVGFEKAVDGIPADKRGSVPPGFEHSVWQLLEHMRLAQKDLLDFCVNPQYVHALNWPDDYWPRNPAPPDKAWNASVQELETDREDVKRLVRAFPSTFSPRFRQVRGSKHTFERCCSWPTTTRITSVSWSRFAGAQHLALIGGATARGRIGSPLPVSQPRRSTLCLSGRYRARVRAVSGAGDCVTAEHPVEPSQRGTSTALVPFRVALVAGVGN